MNPWWLVPICYGIAGLFITMLAVQDVLDRDREDLKGWLGFLLLSFFCGPSVLAYCVFRSFVTGIFHRKNHDHQTSR
jgi:hypothetical protein